MRWIIIGNFSFLARTYISYFFVVCSRHWGNRKTEFFIENKNSTFLETLWVFRYYSRGMQVHLRTVDILQFVQICFTGYNKTRLLVLWRRPLCSDCLFLFIKSCLMSIKKLLKNEFLNISRVILKAYPNKIPRILEQSLECSDYTFTGSSNFY